MVLENNSRVEIAAKQLFDCIHNNSTAMNVSSTKIMDFEFK